MPADEMSFRPRLNFRQGDGFFELLQPLTEARRKEEIVFLLRLGLAVWSGRFSVALFPQGGDLAGLRVEGRGPARAAEPALAGQLGGAAADAPPAEVLELLGAMDVSALLTPRLTRAGS